MLFQITLGYLGDRRALGQLHCHRFRHRLLAGLDPGDDQRRAPPCFLGGEDTMHPDRHPLRRLSAGARLRHIDLPPRGMDPHSEAQHIMMH